VYGAAGCIHIGVAVDGATIIVAGVAIGVVEVVVVTVCAIGAVVVVVIVVVTDVVVYVVCMRVGVVGRFG